MLAILRALLPEKKPHFPSAFCFRSLMSEPWIPDFIVASLLPCGICFPALFAKLLVKSGLQRTCSEHKRKSDSKRQPFRLFCSCGDEVVRSKADWWRAALVLVLRRKVSTPLNTSYVHTRPKAELRNNCNPPISEQTRFQDSACEICARKS